MKIIINHFLDPRIVLTPNVGNDKSWVWVAFDFSEGELVETVSVRIRTGLFPGILFLHFASRASYLAHTSLPDLLYPRAS